MPAEVTPPSTPPAEPFDAIVERLRRVVDALESGKLTLEQSLEAFEQGVKLARRGNTILDDAERRVEILARGQGPDAGDSLVPFETGEPPSRS